MEGTGFRVVFLDEKVVDQLKTLPKRVQSMIKDAIEERLKVDPIGLGKPLQYSWKGHRRLRISSYRVIYRVDAEKKVVTLVYIDIRRDIYD